MPFTVTMPKLSPTMESGTLVKWYKQEGDFVKSGEVLFEVATDKATVEHTALDAGYLRKILVAEKGVAIVNQALAIFTETQEESIEGYQPEGDQPAPKKREEKPQEEAVERPKEPLLNATPLAGPQFVPEPPLTGYKFLSPSETVIASPLARKLAKEKKIDLSTVKGTGPHGRITSRDLDLGQKAGRVTFGNSEKPKLPPGSYEEESLTPMRQVISRRLQESKTFIPHFYLMQEVNMEPIILLRAQLKEMGLTPSINDFVVKACALTLREHPVINSGFHSVNNTIIRFQTVDICIAVSVEGGLMTPIVRHADYKNLGELGSEMKQLAKKAREGKLQREEYAGGSFTISNLGMYGISEFSAIINPPQAAILAVGGVNELPVVREGKIVVGKTMKLTLSADHRVIDGMEAAKFMKDLQKILENPAALLL